MKTETREQNKEWVRSVGLCQRHKPQHPHRVTVSPWGPFLGERAVNKSSLLLLLLLLLF